MIDTERSLQHDIGRDGLFVLRLHDGDARIHATDGEAVVVRARDERPLDGMDVERGDRSLSLRAQRDSGFGLRRRGRHAGELDIDVPASATVVIEAASADIRAEGLTGDQRYRTASGDLVLRGVRGIVNAETVSGDLELTLDGPAERLTLRTVSGDLAVRAGRIAELQGGTTSGDLHIAGDFDAPGPYTIETVSGDLVLAPAGDIELDVRTITGSVRSELESHRRDEDGRRRLVVGRGGPTISFRSTSGDVRVVRAREMALDGGRPAGLARPPRPPALPTRPSLPPMPGRGSSEDAQPPVASPDALDEQRLAILRDLETGRIDVAEAGRRLEALEEPTDA